MPIFACRICKEKFNLTRFITNGGGNGSSAGYSVVSTQCGHLFHRKCLEGALTNQKLLHMRHGSGPLRQFCPVVGCNTSIVSDEAIIPLSFIEGDECGEGRGGSEDTELELIKRIQTVTNKSGIVSENLEKANFEIEILRSVLDEIKIDMSDILSFLKDDHTLRKGDLIFWVTRDGTYAPGKVLEIRKKPGESVHYAIVKLDNKTKVSGVGPHAVNRDTMILPITELTTFKSFFKQYFEKFQSKFESILIDLNSEIQDLSSPTGAQSDRSASYYRSTRKLSRSSIKSGVGSTSQTALDAIDSISVESVPLPAVYEDLQSDAKPEVKLSRSRTVHYGIGTETPKREPKHRSLSWANLPPSKVLSMESPSPTLSEASSKVFLGEGHSFGNLYDEEETSNEFIREGERVIWFDSYSEHEQIGTVAAICEFSPCAIVKFDEHPIVKHKFQYRTVPMDELFPYHLASPEDKHRISEVYGHVNIEFVESREQLSPHFADDFTSDYDEMGSVEESRA